METINYIQVIPQTPEEKYKMYMKCKKSELARMLLARDMLEPEKHGISPLDKKDTFEPPYIVSCSEEVDERFKYTSTTYSDESELKTYSSK